MSCQHPLTAVHHTSHLCTPADQQVHSSSMVLRAVVVLPLLLMVLCVASADDHVLRCIVMAVSLPCTMGSITNRYKEKQALSLIDSSTSPILLELGVAFLKRFISAWLKWFLQETEQRDEELLITLKSQLNDYTFYSHTAKIYAISAAPFAIATVVMLVVLALSCLANILSLLFTIFALSIEDGCLRGSMVVVPPRLHNRVVDDYTTIR